MGFTSLFVAKGKPRLAPDETLAAGQKPTSVGVFVTPQSLASFPVASGAVVGLWLLAQRILGPAAKADWVAVVIALVIGTVIFGTNISEPAVKPKGAWGWTVAIFVAVINSLLLAASAMGISTTKSA